MVVLNRIALLALAVVTVAGSARAQTVPTNPVPIVLNCVNANAAVTTVSARVALPSVPAAINFESWPANQCYFNFPTTTSAFVVIAKAPPPPLGIELAPGPEFVAYGIDVGNRSIVFQLAINNSDDLSSFQDQLNAQSLNLIAQSSQVNMPWNMGVSSNVGKPIPPPPPGGPTGLPPSVTQAEQLLLYANLVTLSGAIAFPAATAQ